MNLKTSTPLGGVRSGIVAALLLAASEPTQYVAGAFGAAGALLLAIPGVHPAWGFAAFLVSNVAWFHFAKQRRHWGLIAQQVVFLITSLAGLWNWWLGPLVLG